MRVLIGAFAFVILAGCGSSPVSSDRADPVPAKRLYAYEGQSDAQLIVVRDGGLYGAGCNYRFYIDGTLAAEFAAGEVARFGLSAGRHILSSTYSGACGGGSVVEREIEVKAGEVVRRRISVITGGAQDISPTAF
ncbi:hypothetical protein [Pseudomonas sp. ML2-2023-6]|uniref:hypothetical protein n=1 Tax=Pseudomonas sp. ML2-2023-6 TaxID=3122376 RepID=UPI0030D169FE